MQLGARGHYAVLAMSDLARRTESGPVALAIIAGEQKISLSFLEQIFVRLRRHGLVRARPGQGGGYMLARPAESINLSEILDSVGEAVAFTRCHTGGEACLGGKTRCANHALWVSLGTQLEQWLQSVSLSDLAAGKMVLPVERLH